MEGIYYGGRQRSAPPVGALHTERGESRHYLITSFSRPTTTVVMYKYAGVGRVLQRITFLYTEGVSF